MPTDIDDVLHDLIDEYDRLDGILRGLTEAQWTSPSDAPGWTIADVVTHLAQSEEGVVTSIAAPRAGWTTRTEALDDVMATRVRSEATTPSETFARWRAASRGSLTALRAADPLRHVPWAAAPLRPRTLATTRLAEHWAHGLDITGALEIEFPDADRLRHVAWLGHATLPYAMRLEGLDPQPVFCALTTPSGAIVNFGPSDASSTITGSLGTFCRVGARRLVPAESGLVTVGPHAEVALRVLRNYAA